MAAALTGLDMSLDDMIQNNRAGSKAKGGGRKGLAVTYSRGGKGRGGGGGGAKACNVISCGFMNQSSADTAFC